MNKIKLISLYVIAILLVSFTLLGNIAKADVSNGLMIAGFTFEDENVSAEKPFKFTVHVLEVEAKEGESGDLANSKPTDDAKVKVTFTKNNISKEVSIDNGKKGNYEGSVVLPVDGEWSLTAVAQPKSGQAVAENNQNVFTTTFIVDEEQSGNSFLWKLLLIIASVLVLIWTLKRLEPKLKNIQKKKPRV